MSKKKPYSSPTVKLLTPEQAKKIIADRKNCTEEAAESLKSLQRQKQNDPKPNEPPKDNEE